ncbi:hypothetical protein PJL18_02685 [Paenarthrobacter nicotinovorans]|nr:hypothetical protein [Paenarthrobacter nicotinovorans]
MPDKMDHMPWAGEEHRLDVIPGPGFGPHQFHAALAHGAGQSPAQVVLLRLDVKGRQVARRCDDAQNPQRRCDVQRVLVVIGGRDVPDERLCLAKVGLCPGIEEGLPWHHGQLRSREPKHYAKLLARMLCCPKACPVSAVHLTGKECLKEFLPHFPDSHLGDRQRPPGGDRGSQDGGLKLRKPVLDAIYIQGEGSGRMPSRRRTDHVHRIFTACRASVDFQLDVTVHRGSLVVPTYRLALRRPPRKGFQALKRQPTRPTVKPTEGGPAVEIYMWWLDLHMDSKEWLRENLRVEELPLQVLQHIAEAGGPHPDKVSGVLTTADWDFIETQSEFVD